MTDVGAYMSASGPSRRFAESCISVAIESEADINSRAAVIDSVAIDPVRTSEPYNTEPIACGRMMVEKLEYVMGVVRKRA